MKTCPNCKELVGDNASKCFNCGYNFDNPSANKEFIEQEKIRKKQAAEQAIYVYDINNKYDYKVLSVFDNYDGSCNTSEIERLLTVYAAEGWRLKAIYSNELGKTARAIGGIGTNSTVDQTIIVLERLVRKAKE